MAGIKVWSLGDLGSNLFIGISSAQGPALQFPLLKFDWIQLEQLNLMEWIV